MIICIIYCGCVTCNRDKKILDHYANIPLMEHLINFYRLSRSFESNFLLKSEMCVFVSGRFFSLEYKIYDINPICSFYLCNI